jgi:hypothetical protein
LGFPGFLQANLGKYSENPVDPVNWKKIDSIFRNIKKPL